MNNTDMNKDMIFFSADGKGLTSTSANYIANLAKEMIRGIESKLDSLVLYSTSVSLIGTEAVQQLVAGAGSEDLAGVRSGLMAVAKAKSLIAWLREAIKARERMLSEAAAIDIEEYAKIMDIKLPEKPEMGKALTEDEYWASLSVDRRNRYYETETVAAVLGKAIHPEGSIANAREGLDNAIREPRRVTGDGRDALIYTYSPSVSVQEVDELYFLLQRKYREAQAELNSMKYECEKAVKDSEIAVSTAYADATSLYSKQMQDIRARMSVYIKERVRDIGKLKILIPESLDEIYRQVSALGKK